jgi:class 3 adenylate cyclase
MVTRPTGTVTFLFTDIEGSTERWERHASWMAAAPARHEAILREAIAAHGGWAYKQVGDAFQAAFQTAPAALAAAVSAQQALAAEPWGEPGPLRVRMALHSGTAEERADDYVGPLLNRVARLLAAGHGGSCLPPRRVNLSAMACLRASSCATWARGG